MTPEDLAAYDAQRELREVEAESVAYTVLGAHGVDSSQYTFDYVAGWAARAATDTTSIADIITATGQRVIAAADRILAHTQPRTSIEDELAGQWTQAVQPSPVIAAETMPWETVAEAPSDAARAAHKTPPQAPHAVLAVSR
jgi:hypothetical protein